MTLTTRLVCALTAAGMAIAPVAAQAGTRAASAPVAADMAQVSSAQDVHRKRPGFGLTWGLLLLAALAAVAAAAGGGGTSNNRTRG